MCIVSSGHRFLERVSRSKGLITFTMYFLMVGLATIGIFGKTQYPNTFTPRWVNACMISSGLCCVLGLATACLVTHKNVDSQTPDAASAAGVTAASAAASGGGPQAGIATSPNAANSGAQLSQMYNTQVSPVLTVSVLDMDVTTGRSTFLPLIGYPVNHDFNLQLLLPNRYGNAEQILGVHLPQNGQPGQLHRTIVQGRPTDAKTPTDKALLADHLNRIAVETQQGKTVQSAGSNRDDNGERSAAGDDDQGDNNNNSNNSNNNNRSSSSNNGRSDNSNNKRTAVGGGGGDNNKKKVETPPPSYSSLEISVQCCSSISNNNNNSSSGAATNCATTGEGPPMVTAVIGCSGGRGVGAGGVTQPISGAHASSVVAAAGPNTGSAPPNCPDGKREPQAQPTLATTAATTPATAAAAAITVVNVGSAPTASSAVKTITTTTTTMLLDDQEDRAVERPPSYDSALCHLAGSGLDVPVVQNNGTDRGGGERNDTAHMALANGAIADYSGGGDDVRDHGGVGGGDVTRATPEPQLGLHCLYVDVAKRADSAPREAIVMVDDDDEENKEKTDNNNSSNNSSSSNSNNNNDAATAVNDDPGNVYE